MLNKLNANVICSDYDLKALLGSSTLQLLDDVLDDELEADRHLVHGVRLANHGDVDKQALAACSVERLEVDEVTEILPGILRHFRLHALLPGLETDLVGEILEVQAGGELHQPAHL